MKILSILCFALLGLILMSMLAKTRPYSKGAISGKTLLSTPLSLLSKIFLHRFALGPLITGLILTTLTGWMPLNISFMVAAFALVIILLPMKLTLTSKGLALGDGIYRSWDEFGLVKVKRTHIELTHPSNFMKVVLFVNPRRSEKMLNLLNDHISATLPNG